MSAGCRCRSLLEVHRLMQVRWCVGCVGVLLPARTPSYRSMGVNPPPLGGYRPPPLRLRWAPPRLGALSEVLHQRSVPTPPSYPPATRPRLTQLVDSGQSALHLRDHLLQAQRHLRQRFK